MKWLSNKTRNEFENIYERYSSLIFGIVSQNYASDLETNEIVAIIFYRLLIHKSSEPLNNIIVIGLSNMVMRENDHEPNYNFFLNEFDRCTFVNKLLFLRTSAAHVCKKVQINRAQLGKKLREEINFLRKNLTTGEVAIPL